ncbi:MAG: tRNA pseudouridine(13) synthase TruD, partial [Thermoplasmata archaeon HGW-Thermoplasmata-2]
QLRIGYGAVGFAGTKDKRAVISQQISLDAPLSAVETLRFDDFEILEAFRSNRWLEIGDLIGNRFEIVVRDTDFGDAEKLRSAVSATSDLILREGGFPNFFGIQRFGAVRITTHTIGKFIAHGDLKGAVLAYIANPMEGERADIFAARKMISDGANFADVLKEYPDKFELERRMIRHLIDRPEDWAGAIRQLPKHLQTMFVYAYQSYLFNRILSERIRRGIPLSAPIPGDIIIPCTEHVVPEQKDGILVSERNLEKIARRVKEGKALVTGLVFGSGPLFAECEPGEIERKVVEAEGLRPENFVVPQIPYLSSKGTRRALMVPMKKLDWEVVTTGIEN